jgi:hypothetical protein
MTQHGGMETQLEKAIRLLAELFRGRERIAIAEATTHGQVHGVSRRTMSRAARQLGVQEVHNGRLPAFWELPSGGAAS